MSVDDAFHRDARANQRLRLLIDGVKDFAIFMLNPDGNVSTWNAGAERLKGYRADEIIGQHYSQFYPHDDGVVGPVNRELGIAEREGRFEEEAWRVRKDGSRFWADVVITPLRNPAGELIGFGKVTRNLSDQAARSKDQFRAAIEASPTGMILVDPGGRIVLVNREIERLFGYHRDELIGHRIEMLMPERFRELHPQTRAAFFNDPKSRPMGAGRELHGLHKDSSEVPIEIGLNPLETPDGHFVLASVLDITERKRSEGEREGLLRRLQTINSELEQRVQARTLDLSANLKEREVLLQEVHHRVKNNLQVITSLISMQTRQIEAGASRTALEQCQTRVGAIALIHEKLYQSQDYARVPFSEYAKSLAEGVFQMAGITRDTVSLEFAVEDLTVAIDRAIPCGLILNELITNALKHAFPGDRTGSIRVTLARLGDGRMRMTVSDDGVGLPSGLEAATSGSLGMHLVRMLASQVDGELRMESSNGTSVTLTVPLGD
jgi:PAS domain S-box-containing protein